MTVQAYIIELQLTALTNFGCAPTELLLPTRLFDRLLLELDDKYLVRRETPLADIYTITFNGPGGATKIKRKKGGW